MLKRKCKECGELMYFQHVSQVNTFCSKACYHEHRRKQLTIVDDGPVMPPLDASKITDEGYVALVKAIVKQASRDVTNHKPGTRVRVQAEKFFESDYFAALTGLDGQAILRDLHEEYNKKKRRLTEDKAFVRRRVRCVETNKEYKSIKAAAEACGISGKMLQQHLSGISKSAGGLHWRYVEEEHATE